MAKDKVSKPKVTRQNADAVFIATATEKLRKPKAKNVNHLHPNQAETIRKKAQDIVDKANEG